jgi:hypothetical protein
MLARSVEPAAKSPQARPGIWRAAAEGVTLALAMFCPDCPPARAARAWALDDLLAGAGYAVLPFAIAGSVIALVGAWLARKEAPP